MITVKTLCGDLLSLQKENPEQDYLTRYVKSQFRPFTRVHIQDYEGEKVILVNVHEIHPLLEENICWESLSLNPAAIPYLKKNIDKIDWPNLCCVPEAIDLIRENQDKIDWEELSGNEVALDLLLQYPDKAVWPAVARWVKDCSVLSGVENVLNDIEVALGFLHNPNCKPNWVQHMIEFFSEEHWVQICCIQNSSMLELLFEFPQHINWYFISMNSSPVALSLMERYPEQIRLESLCMNRSETTLRKLLPRFSVQSFSPTYWKNLSTNSSAIFFLLQHPDKIGWKFLSSVSEAGDLLKRNTDKIDWYVFSCNTTDMDFLEQNLDKVHHVGLSNNPNGIELLAKHPEMIAWNTLIWNENAGSLILNNMEHPAVQSNRRRLFRRSYIFCPSLEDF